MSMLGFKLKHVNKRGPSYHWSVNKAPYSNEYFSHRRHKWDGTRYSNMWRHIYHTRVDSDNFCSNSTNHEPYLCILSFNSCGYLSDLNFEIWYSLPCMRKTVSLIDTVECRYNAVQYNMILFTALQRQRLKWKKTPHTSRARYGVSFVRIWEKMDRVLTAPHCIVQHGCIQRRLIY